MEIMLHTNPNSATIGRKIPWITNWNNLLSSTSSSPDWNLRKHEVFWISSELESLIISPNEILAMVKISTTYTIDILATICTLILFNLIAIDVVCKYQDRKLITNNQSRNPQNFYIVIIFCRTYLIDLKMSISFYRVDNQNLLEAVARPYE